MSKFQEYIKNIFWVLLIIQFAPPIFKSVEKRWLDYTEPKNKVGFINLNTSIMSSANWNKQLQKFFKDDEIKAILIKIDSPGGAAGSSQAICQEILRLKKLHPKPVVAYAENVCASGAYYIAATADHIIATGSALVGSIGSKICTQFKVKELLQNYKVQPHAIASGSYKNATDPFTDFTDDQKKMLQELVDDCYDQFAGDIIKYRHLNPAEKNLWGDGRIFTGMEALKLKLIDEIGNQTSAIDYIKKQILHADREIELVKTPAPSKLHKWLYPDSDSNDDGVDESITDSLWSSLFTSLQKQRLMF